MSTVIKKSNYTVSETMDKFEEIVREKGLAVIARINHQANAQKVELTMNPAEVLIFGNPKAGTLIMRENVAAALDLPMRVAVYENDNGVFIAYHDPQSMANSYDIPGLSVLDQMQNALNAMTDIVIA